ncbi:putative pyrroloquinoline-quinone binding quinoprotein [Solirubrobacter pauli]|uniref:Putative pyrroloquinoline-quinone binding quinoprotein n=1 Tax=Solirubrobacter pauli TaxID=166793 RepID=A0A660L184_9ACTN|nr:PQQ-binding-like beta-propeller repeat protein [Solirubrobacter pauli]RKQ87707.1 putative pyrroloquinoline-quinone binding quinoprotein [Solirubrobacter pauli]
MVARSLLTVALTLVVTATASAAPARLPYVNGTVSDLLVDGDTLYVGGQFTVAGTAAGPLVLARGDTGALVRTFPGFGKTGEGDISAEAVLSDGAGGWYVGGGFARVDGEPRHGLVHLLADGSVDRAFSGPPRWGAHVLARHGDVLWLNGWSGYEEETPEAERGPRLLALNARTGAPLAIAPALSSAVTDLDVEDGRLFVSTRRHGVYAFDAATGAATGWHVSAGREVEAIDVDGGVVWATDQAPGQESGESDVVGYRVSDGAALPQTFRYAADATDLVATEDFVFIVCDCWRTNQPSLQAYDRDTGQYIDLRAMKTVERVAVGGGRLYAGGPGGYVAYDLATLQRVPWAVDLLDARPRAIAVAPDGTVALAGYNSAVAGAARTNLAAFRLSTGELLPFDPAPLTPLPDWFGPGYAPAVWALEKAGDLLFAAGYFSRAAGVPRKSLAAFDLRTGALVDFPEPRSRLVQDLVVADGKLIAGGEIIEAFDLASRTKLAWEAWPHDAVRALAVVDDTLLAGGEFYAVEMKDGPIVPRKFLAAFHVSDLSPSPRFAAEPSSYVNDITPDGAGGAFLAGYFRVLGAVPSDFVGHLDATGAPEPNFPGSDGYGAGSVVADSSHLYVSGVDGLGGLPRRGSAAIRLADRSVTAFDPGVGGRAMIPLPSGELLVGGDFRSTSHNSSSGIGWFLPDGSTAVPAQGGGTGTSPGTGGGNGPSPGGGNGNGAGGGDGTGGTLGDAAPDGGTGAGGDTGAADGTNLGGAGRTGASSSGEPVDARARGSRVRVAFASRRVSRGRVSVRVASPAGGRVTVRVRLASGRRTVLGRATVTLRPSVARVVRIRVAGRAVRRAVVAEAEATVSRAVRLR